VFVSESFRHASGSGSHDPPAPSQYLCLLLSYSVNRASGSGSNDPLAPTQYLSVCLLESHSVSRASGSGRHDPLAPSQYLSVCLLVTQSCIQQWESWPSCSVAISVCNFLSHSVSHASGSGSHDLLSFAWLWPQRWKWNYPCCKLKIARRGAKLRFCYTWEIEFVLSDVPGIANSRGPPSCKANKLIRFSPVASVL